MKKIINVILVTLLVVLTMGPLPAKAQELAPDDVLLNVINGLKEIESFKGDFEGNMDLIYPEGTMDYTVDGRLQVKIAPELEVGFDLDATMNAEHNDGSTMDETYHLLNYIIDETMYTFEEDSTKEGESEWVTADLTTVLGMPAEQITTQYQMLVSVIEGSIRSYYIPSRVHQLLSEKTTVEEHDNGYTVTINSFETEEEWIEFFEALEELGMTVTQETVDSGVEISNQIENYEDQAIALADGLNYTITIEVDEDYFITAINVVVDSDVQTLEEASASEPDPDMPESLQVEFNYNVTDKNFNESIEVPDEVPVGVAS